MSALTLVDGGNWFSVTSESEKTDSLQKGQILLIRRGDNFKIAASYDRKNLLFEFETDEVVSPVVADGDALETFLQGALFS